MTKYLVTGASGQLGQLTVDHLATLVAKDDIIALVRTPEQAAIFAAKGIETRNGDYEDPASLEAAFAGVDRLLLIASSSFDNDVRISHHANAINAAKAAGVGFIAYTSILNAKENTLGLAIVHKAAEIAIEESGLPHTILRNGWYTENMGMGIAQALQMGQHFGAAGDGKYATASRQDYAEAAAIVLVGGHDGEVLELAGDEAFTLTDFAQTLTDLSGKPVAYVDMPVQAFNDALVGAGVPEGFISFMVDVDSKLASGVLFDDSKTLSKLIGRPTTPYAETLKPMVG